MTRFFFLLIVCVGVSTMPARSYAKNLKVHRAKIHKVAADEVYVRQERGFISRDSKSHPPAINMQKTVPEGRTQTQASPTNPNTCDSRNASSPACYTATQQGRAK